MHQYLGIVIGAAAIALSLEVCYIPHHMIDGGMTGLAVVVGRSTGVAPANILFVLNALCLWLGMRTLGLRFIYKAAAGLVTLWLLLALIAPLRPSLPAIAAALAGGAGVGLGVALILLAGAGLDGCEILAQVAQVRYRIPVFWFQLLVNALVMGLVAILYGVRAAFLSIVAQGAGQLVLFWLLPRGRHKGKYQGDKRH